MCSTLWQERMVLPGASDRKDLERLEDDCLGSGVRDTKDLRPAIPQPRKRFLQLMKGFELPQK